MTKTPNKLWALHKPEYQAWIAMRHRCRNPKHHDFVKWGAVGVTVSDAWYNSFPVFLRDMGTRPSPAHSLARVDTAQGYYDGNCIWATKRERAYKTNLKVTKKKRPPITFNGVTRTNAEWAASLNISTSTLTNRIYIYGWPLERALTTSGVQKRGRKPQHKS